MIRSSPSSSFTDNGTATDFAGVSGGSGAFGTFYIDVDNADGSGRLNLSDLANTSDIDVTAGFAGKLDVNMHVDFEFIDSPAIPKLKGDFVVTQEFGVSGGTEADATGDQASFGGAPTVEFQGISLDLGSFITGIAGPAFDQIDKVIDPIRPLIKVLETKIPVISELERQTETFLTLAEQFGGGDAKVFLEAVDFVLAAINLIDQVESTLQSSGEVVIDIGTYKLGGEDHDVRSGDNKTRRRAARRRCHRL